MNEEQEVVQDAVQSDAQEQPALVQLLMPLKQELLEALMKGVTLKLGVSVHGVLNPQSVADQLGNIKMEICTLKAEVLVTSVLLTEVLGMFSDQVEDDVFLVRLGGEVRNLIDQIKGSLAMKEELAKQGKIIVPAQGVSLAREKQIHRRRGGRQR